MKNSRYLYITLNMYSRSDSKFIFCLLFCLINKSSFAKHGINILNYFIKEIIDTNANGKPRSVTAVAKSFSGSPMNKNANSITI